MDNGTSRRLGCTSTAMLCFSIACGGQSRDLGDEPSVGGSSASTGGTGTAGTSAARGGSAAGGLNGSGGGSGAGGAVGGNAGFGDCSTLIVEIRRDQAPGTSLIVCDFAVPLPDLGRDFRPDYVNVALLSVTGEVTLIRKVADLYACFDEVGWYYDDDALPQRIILCPASCDLTLSGNYVQLTVATGCSGIPDPPP